MKVQNLMEEYVHSRVSDLYDKLSENKPVWLSCTCESCRLDVITYVLNKVHPLYVVSGRGVVYSSQAIDNQVKADVDALVMEGIRTVSGNTRPEHQTIAFEKENSSEKNAPAFNFPVISGSVINGTTFEPYYDATVTLKDLNGNVLMQDASWDNPCKTFKSTKGSFSFWPKSIPAAKSGITQKFTFIIEAKAENCKPVTCAVTVPAISDEKTHSNFDANITLKIKDLYLFKS